jgi:hypothetical protein
MLPRRAPLVLTALGLAAAALPAQAAARPPAKVCNLVSDPDNDSGWLVSAVKSPTIEIVGVDMASGKKNVTLVLKLKSTSFETTDPVKFMTATWSVGFTVGAESYSTHRHTSYTGDVVEDSMTRNNVKIGTPTVAVDATTITYTFPRTWVPSLAHPKQVFKDLRATTAMLLASSDTAWTQGVKYNDRAASCVKTS